MVPERSYKMKKIVSLIVSVAMLTAIVAGCSDDNTNETTEATTTVEAATEETTEATTVAETEETEPEVATVSFTDSLGHEVEIPAEPQKVVSISPALTEIVYALGQGDKLVGRTDYDDYPVEVFDVPSVGDLYTPDLEAIAATEPDLVIASSIFTEESFDAITALGIPTVIIVDEESFDGTYGIISDVATVLGCPDAGEALNADLKARYEAVATEPADDAMTVYYCMGFGEWGEFTAGGDTFINDIINAAGANNAASDVDGWSYSLEALIAADPDIILLSTWVDYETFTTTAPYSDLSAVKNGQVYSVDGNLFERQGPRNVEGIEFIADILASMDVAEAA